MTLAAFLLVACDKEKVVQSTDLPPNASGFVSTHFSGNRILQVVKELDNLKTFFHVYLDNGTKLDFSRLGDLKKIEGMEPIPNTVIPAMILNYVTANYPDDFIRGWEIEDATQDAILSTGVKLEFDKNGNFLRIDG